MRSLLDVTAEKLTELRLAAAMLQLRLALKKYDPNQPRWPGGSSVGGISVGGRWRETGTGDVAQAEGVHDPSRLSMCLAQLALDEELCRMAKSRRCWVSSQERYVNCMRNVYVPPLEVGR